jgi:hypothetical protein
VRNELRLTFLLTHFSLFGLASAGNQISELKFQKKLALREECSIIHSQTKFIVRLQILSSALIHGEAMTLRV